MKKIITIVIALLCAVAIAGYKMYNKPHRSIEDEDPIVISSVELFNAFVQNENEANKLYLDKVMEVSGVISEIITNQDGKSVVVLSSNHPMFGINCTMEDAITNIQTGSVLSIKGICTGYLSDVVITHGIVERGELKIKQ